MAPGVPELWEAMQEEHGWAGHRAGGGDVEFYAVGLNGSVGGLLAISRPESDFERDTEREDGIFS